MSTGTTCNFFEISVYFDPVPMRIGMHHFFFGILNCYVFQISFALLMDGNVIRWNLIKKGIVGLQHFHHSHVDATSASSF